MRRSAFAVAAVLTGVLLVGASPTNAQAVDEAFMGTLYLVDADPADALSIEGGTGFGAAFGGHLTPYIGLEGALQRVSDLDFSFVNGTTSMRELRLTSLFYFNKPKDWLLPYVAVGLGYMDFSDPVALDKKTLRREAKAAGRSKNDFRYSEDAARYDQSEVINWGLGAHFLLSERVSLRLDLRWVASFDHKQSFNQFEPMFGLTIWSGKGS